MAVPRAVAKAKAVSGILYLLKSMINNKLNYNNYGYLIEYGSIIMPKMYFLKYQLPYKSKFLKNFLIACFLECHLACQWSVACCDLSLPSTLSSCSKLIDW